MAGTDAHRRTLVKTLLYRVLMLITTIVVAYLFTNQVDTSLKIGIGTNALKMLIYYGYERAWSRTTWGMH